MKKQVDHEEIMMLAIQKARHTMSLNIGGPFGAAIVDAEGTILSVASNSVLKDHDPTGARRNQRDPAGRQSKSQP
ncbi:MAG: hypothetical protein MZU97_06020 [Bacillus subtilis]|nr:hypothetical protein [Bacillus subtilis]